MNILLHSLFWGGWGGGGVDEYYTDVVFDFL